MFVRQCHILRNLSHRVIERITDALTLGSLAAHLEGVLVLAYVLFVIV